MHEGERLGFHSVDREYDERLPVEGTLPGWLRGTLVRNGPGRFSFENGRVDHWFDGLAMLRRFHVADGEVHYRTRFLDTGAYEAAERGEYGGFGTAPGTGLLRRVLDRLRPPETTDNTNVNVWRYGDEYVALTETPQLTTFDPETLATRERTAYPDAIDGQTTTAHPHHDRERGVTVNVATRFGRTSTYHVYRIPDGTTDVETVGRVETAKPAYLHSFGLTDRYVVLAEFPLRVSPLSLLAPTDRSFIERFDWEPDRGTVYHVLDRRTGKVVAEPVGEPLFCFHHVNAHEATDDAAGTAAARERGAGGSRTGLRRSQGAPDGLVLDMVTFPDASAMETLSLASLADGDDADDGEAGDGWGTENPAEGGRLTRVRLDLDAGTTTRERLHPGAMGLPRIAPAARRRPYRYVYAQDNQGQPVAAPPQGVMKVDVRTGTADRYVRDGCRFHEPVFVPDPHAGGAHGGREDAGVVLTCYLDEGAERSVFLVLDARTMTELARAPLPHALPFDFHGQFFRAEG